jgi:hypothetical protein
MFSHPHATETEGRTREGYCVAFGLSHVRGTVKEGTRFGQTSTGQDGLSPFDGQGAYWPREGRSVVKLNGLAEQRRRWLKAVYHLQGRGHLTGCLHGDGGVRDRAAGSGEGVMRPAQHPLWVGSGPQQHSARVCL